MDASTIDAIDNFVNDASDQAAAWYSIVKQQPVVVPSAQIASQDAQATAPILAGGITTPLGTSLDTSSLMLLALGIVAVIFLLKDL